MTDEELIARLRSVHTSADDEAAADRMEALVNEAVLSKAAYEGVSSMLLSVQQDCIKERQRAKAAEVLAEKLQAECLKLGREVNMARYGQPDFAWSIHKQAMAELQARAERLEAALREISNRPDYRLPKPQDIARAALKGGDHE